MPILKSPESKGGEMTSEVGGVILMFYSASIASAFEVAARVASVSEYLLKVICFCY